MHGPLHPAATQNPALRVQRNVKCPLHRVAPQARELGVSLQDIRRVKRRYRRYPIRRAHIVSMMSFDAATTCDAPQGHVSHWDYRLWLRPLDEVVKISSALVQCKRSLREPFRALNESRIRRFAPEGISKCKLITSGSNTFKVPVNKPPRRADVRSSHSPTTNLPECFRAICVSCISNQKHLIRSKTICRNKNLPLLLQRTTTAEGALDGHAKTFLKTGFGGATSN